MKRFQDQGEFEDLMLNFHPEENIDGYGDLLKYCEQSSKRSQHERTVCLFDRDVKRIMKEITRGGSDYREWREDLYSVALPIPNHRADEPQISIELLYTDEDLTTTDSAGRRIFLSTEFNRPSGRLADDPSISTTSGAIKSKPFFKKVVDGQVYNERSESLALTKDAFADYVEKSKPGFDSFDITGFKPLFELLVLLAKA